MRLLFRYKVIQKTQQAIGGLFSPAVQHSHRKSRQLQRGQGCGRSSYAGYATRPAVPFVSLCLVKFRSERKKNKTTEHVSLPLYTFLCPLGGQSSNTLSQHFLPAAVLFVRPLALYAKRCKNMLMKWQC